MYSSRVAQPSRTERHVLGTDLCFATAPDSLMCFSPVPDDHLRSSLLAVIMSTCCILSEEARREDASDQSLQVAVRLDAATIGWSRTEFRSLRYHRDSAATCRTLDTPLSSVPLPVQTSISDNPSLRQSFRRQRRRIRLLMNFRRTSRGHSPQILHWCSQAGGVFATEGGFCSKTCSPSSGFLTFSEEVLLALM